MKRMVYGKRLSKGSRWLLALLLAAPVAAFAQDETEDIEEVEGFTVVGTRIQRADMETVSPSINLNRESLEQTGFTTAGDAIRALPIVSGQSLTSIDAGTSFTPGVSSVNLRGLGNNNTLALLNGRRVAPFASPGFNGFQNVVDLNSIPTSAIETIQVLKDGASAIYGSDAVAGVLDVQLVKEFDGLVSDISFGNTLQGGSEEYKVSITAGARSGKSSVVFIADFMERNPLMSHEVDWTDETNSPSFANVVANASPDFVNYYTLKGLPASNAWQDLPTIEESLAFTPNDFNVGPSFAPFNYQEVTGFIPKQRNSGFYTRLSYDILPSLEAYAEVSFRRVETSIDAAPTPLFSWNEGVDLNMPPENPFNPFGEELFLGWRMIEFGNRVNIVQTDTPRLVAGLTGDIANTGWEFDSGFLFTESTTTNENSGTVFDDRLQEAIREGVEIDGEVLWANPFGENHAEIIDYVSGNNPTKDSFELWSWDASVNGDLLDLETGVIKAAAGVEYRYEELTSIRTQANISGNIVGGSQSSSVFGDRDIRSIYAEVSVPVYDLLEVQVAGRYEDYSDFGDTSKPKVGFKLTPIDGLLLRGSFSQSFRAPDLPLLYSSSSVSFTADFYEDPLRPGDPESQIQNRSGGNPDLQPEETDTYSLGAQVDFGEMVEVLEGLVFQVDLWRFEQTDVFSRFGAGQVVVNAGDPFFDQFIVREEVSGGGPGPILYVETDWQNLDEQETSGIDIGISYVKRTRDAGEFRFSLDMTYMDSYDTNTLDFDENGDEIQVSQGFAGTWNFPRMRASGSIAWTYGDWSAAIYANYVGEYGPNSPGDPDVDPYLRWNPQVAYSGLWDTTVTVGVRNVFDSAPPVDLGDVTNVNNSIHNAEPRFVYVRLSKEW